jgi:hypothetical protein
VTRTRPAQRSCESAPGQLAVVGTAVAPGSAASNTGTVSITTDLYATALRRLSVVAIGPLAAGPVQVTGARVTAAAELRSLGVGSGEGAVLISEASFRDLAAPRLAP